jgi:hypothetical protein
VIDLLWTGIGALCGAEIGMIGAWAADYGRKRRAWVRRYAIGLGAPLGAAIAAAASLVQPPSPTFDASGPLLTAVHDRYPATFAQMVAATEGVPRTDQTTMQARLRPIMAALIQAHRPEMDDDSAQAVGRLMLDETEAMREAQPDVCVAVLDGRPTGVDLRVVSGPALQRRDAEVTAKLVEQLSTRPAEAPTPLAPDESRQLSDHALAKLSSGDRDVVTPLLLARRTPSTPREAAAYCAFQRARLGAAIDAQPGTLRRFLAAG